jgi:hypothetical protein
MCFETKSGNVNWLFVRRTSVFFPNISHYIINNGGCVNIFKLLLLNKFITYYNNFINPVPPITEDSTIEFILECLWNNTDIIALIICADEIV